MASCESRELNEVTWAAAASRATLTTTMEDGVVGTVPQGLGRDQHQGGGYTRHALAQYDSHDATPSRLTR